MSEVVRLYRYKSLLSNRTAVSAEDLMAALEVSRATLRRDITKLRDQLLMPIEYNRELGGYQLAKGHTDSELPGLWFSQEEILSLVTIQHLLEQLEPGLLGAKLKPLKGRLSQLMDKHGLASQNVAQRIRLVHADKRKDLNAWCHLRDDVRNFSIDAITKLEMLETDAKAVTVKAIDQALGSSYGIFNGATQGWAKLKFTAERARWVAGETWHAMQESSFEADGSYLLSFPYSDDRELLGDIMRYGSDVQVLAPAALRSKVQRCFLEAAARYV